MLYSYHNFYSYSNGYRLVEKSYLTVPIQIISKYSTYSYKWARKSYPSLKK